MYNDIDNRELDLSNDYSFNIENVRFSMWANKFAPRDKYVQSYSHSFFVIIFLMHGSATLEIEGETIQIKGYEAVVVAPKTKHLPAFDVLETVGCCICFNYQNNRLETSNDLFKKIETLLSSRSYLQINDKNFYELLQKCFNSISLGNKYVTGLSFYELIIALLLSTGRIKSDSGTNDIFSDSNVMRLHKINTLANVYYDKNISIDDIAEMLFISTRQAMRIVQSNFGCTWHKLVTRKRMNAAMDLLQKTDMTVEKIGEYVGYETTRGFYTAFKKYYNNSPSSYRE